MYFVCTVQVHFLIQSIWLSIFFSLKKIKQIYILDLLVHTGRSHTPVKLICIPPKFEFGIDTSHKSLKINKKIDLGLEKIFPKYPIVIEYFFKPMLLNG